MVIARQKSRKENWCFRSNNGYHLIDPAHIIYCKAAGAYTQIILDNEKSFLISRNLGRTQELMPDGLFVRAHQSYLVNLNHIKKYRKGGIAGGYYDEWRRDKSIADKQRQTRPITRHTITSDFGT